jgi:hypothetical protein
VQQQLLRQQREQPEHVQQLAEGICSHEALATTHLLSSVIDESVWRTASSRLHTDADHCWHVFG